MGRELEQYIETLYGDRAGYVYVASKQTAGGFKQDFYNYPDQRGELSAAILGSIFLGETYICPSLFATPKGTKDQCLGSSVSWVDFDGNFPSTWPQAIPKPSMVVQTSHETHVHAYWKLDTFLPAAEIEEINRRLSYFFGADLSGWDANQLLRPPETRNHKRGKQVRLTTGPAGIYKLGDFIGLKSPPALPKNVDDIQVLPIEEALENITWPSNLKELFENGLPEGKRSQGMFALAAGLAELNVSPPVILSVLLYSDNNAFKKFKDRPDQKSRLVELVTRAVSKVKTNQIQKKEEPRWQTIKPSVLLTTEYKLEWLMSPLIHKTTCAILSGPPGVGKSLMSLSISQCLVLGKPFLGLAPTKKLRIGFISLEMDRFELHEAVSHQFSQYSDSDLEILDENLIIAPMGEPKFFNDKETERNFFEFVGDNHLDGIFIDSLSSTTAGDLSSEKETKFIFELDAKLRAKFNCFTWYIHHNRKAQADNKRPNKLADLHGSVHIQSKPTTIITLWPLDQKNSRISFKPLKLRSHQLTDDTTVSRDEYLHYFINHDQAGSSTFGKTAKPTGEVEKEVEVDAVGDNDQDPPSEGGGNTGDPLFDF